LPLGDSILLPKAASGGNLTKSLNEEKSIHPGRKKRDTRGGDGPVADETRPEEGESSSAPSSSSDDGEDASSSSVPSSDDDSVRTAEGSDMSALVAEAAPVLKVIAPKQPAANAHSRNKRKRDEAADEAIDDFDDDMMGSERRGGDALSQTTDDKAAERALRLSKLPLEQAARHWNLPRFLVDNLREDSYERFLPIQCMVIPDVIESERNSHLRGARDVCCHSPTGSGKTLAFVLPILTALHDGTSCGGARGLRRLRALVVLPSRDLARQVHGVFMRYSKGSRIKIGLAVGGGRKRTDLTNERRSLVVESQHESTGHYKEDDGTVIRRRSGGPLEEANARVRHSFDPTSISEALSAFDGRGSKDSCFEATPKICGISAVDILVCTPGRLVDHLDSTPGFTLQHLRFIVIDEADRLVNQPYQNWIRRVLQASNSENCFEPLNLDMSFREYIRQPLRTAPDGQTFNIDPVTHRIAGSGAAHSLLGDSNTTESGLIGGTIGRPVPLRKLLFSATLTQDPQKLARLGLDNPKHYDANYLKKHQSGSATEEAKAGKYFLPVGLRESMVECTAEQKPLVLLALLLDERRQHKMVESSEQAADLTIVFTSSVDSTHRLARLLQLLWAAGGYGLPSHVAEYSSSIDTKQRAAILRRCRSSLGENEKVSVLVCSDGMARGMDLPSVGVVINYDVPSFAKTYIHRCGRTARCGRTGRAINVLKGGQVNKFRKMRSLIDGGADAVHEGSVKKDLVKGALPLYKACVKALQKVITAENDEDMGPSSSVERFVPRRKTS